MDLATVDALLPASTTAWRPGDAYLAGGTFLFSEPQPGLQRLLDLTAYGWPSLTDLPGGDLEIAATCTFAELAARGDHPLFRQCCDALLGSFKVWNAATVGGNVCLALPAAPMISLGVALDGTCVVWTADGASREIDVADFVLGPRRTGLAEGEFLRAIRLPDRALRSRTAFRQLSLTPFGRSATLVIGRVDPDGSCTVTVTAATPRPVRVRFARVPSVETAIALTMDSVAAWHDDLHGDPRWRAAMTRRLVAEVVDELRG